MATGRRFHSYTLRIFFVVYFLFTLLYLSRESRQKRFSNSATREAAKWEVWRWGLSHVLPVTELLLIDARNRSSGQGSFLDLGP